EQGLELGRAQGIREVAERAQSGLGALAKVATAAEEAFALESAQLADACTEIVAEAFVKLAGRRLGTRKAAVSVVLQVLKRIKDGRELTIKVSAADLPMLQSQESDIARVLGTRRWTLMADARVSLGGCLVESVLGTLDGRLEVQLRELFETLRAARVSRLEVE
ncbi:MAG TPA: FliH/SctL family protein, partial [Steroidobacteraceae bacterium]|nr:FliH/SctL family protein [Steroidobacteraceae bacterium]